MSVLRIPCPNCGKSLQLHDRRYLGRRGKCAACGHSFVLNEPEPEVVLQPVVEVAPVFDATSAGASTGETGPDAVTSLLAQLRRKRARRRKVAIAAGAVTALVFMAAIALLQSRLPLIKDTNDSPHDVGSSHLPSQMAAAAIAAAIDASPVGPSRTPIRASSICSGRR